MITTYNILSHKKPTRPLLRNPCYVIASVLVAIGSVALLLSCCGVRPFAPLKNRWVIIAIGVSSGEWLFYTGWSLKNFSPAPSTPAQAAVASLQSAPNWNMGNKGPSLLPKKIEAFLDGSLSVVAQPLNYDADFFCDSPVALNDQGRTTSFHDHLSVIDWHHLPEEYSNYATQPANEMLGVMRGKDPIKYYAINGFELVNEFLRSARIRAKGIYYNKLPTTLQEAAQKTMNMVLCISAQLNSCTSFVGRSYRQAYYSPEFIADNFRVGDNFLERGFCSTTKRERIDEFGGPAFGRAYAKPGDKKVIFTIEGQRGKDIMRVSGVGLEAEVLFLPYTSFRVVEKQNCGDHFEITLKEIVK